ncbi:DnaB-like helicase C terminal domain-containing protein [Chitinophaga sp. YR573]|uniref:DnaB-like helicase C-terminal domain-containing protein n=1 Tax=Chitinophaga sp. YR573 TaxID=1881040 RepID=UPI0008D32241|nr:DnaB-like helicase C-terminal domain-containing protein [Chitinophaga sp. YR573]SEW21861.1 DnaB-like helicase C terminal domain-containing protein [Chitinophaga sp. YR573]
MQNINTGESEEDAGIGLFDSFMIYVDQGLDGIHEGIPIGIEKLDEYLSLRKSMLYVLGGYTGSAKTSLVDDLFVLNPYDYMLRNGKPEKLRIIYWSMERKKVFKVAKWVSHKIFKDTGRIIPMKRLLGWVRKEQRLNEQEQEIVRGCKEYFDNMFKYIRIIDGRQNPTGIRKEIQRIAEENGDLRNLNQFERVYKPSDPSITWLHIFDHVGKLKGENGKNLKETIDSFSDDTSNYTRDLFGHSAVILSQFNRDIANPFRLKNGDVEPRLEDFKNTGDLTEDADLVMSIFDPWRYKVLDPNGYDLNKLRSADGAKMYRLFNILKSSYDTEGIRIGLAFLPQTGIFKGLPPSNTMTSADYESVINYTIFKH